MQLKKQSLAREDEQFLFSLYSSTRLDELAMVPWDAEQKRLFLLDQFQSQHQYYRSKYENGNFQIIKLDDRPIGRLYTAELADEIRIIDITILDEFRGKNIGTALIKEILQDAEKQEKSVRIYLEINDKSANLFSRLGFVPIAVEGLHRLWQKSANSRANSAEG